jgi:hypothetical protein
MEMLLKLLFLTLCIVILYRIVRALFFFRRKCPDERLQGGEAGRFDARGEDITDGEYKELK